MDAGELKALYSERLRQELAVPPLYRNGTLAVWYLLNACRRKPPEELEEVDDRVWLWSDLHLGHDASVRMFNRPYEDADDMDDVLFDAWQATVKPADTIENLGDAAIGGLSGRRLKRFRRAPGSKILVLGNHEFDGTAAGHVEGFDEVHAALYAGGCLPPAPADPRASGRRP